MENVIISKQVQEISIIHVERIQTQSSTFLMVLSMYIVSQIQLPYYYRRFPVLYLKESTVNLFKFVFPYLQFYYSYLRKSKFV